MVSFSCPINMIVKAMEFQKEMRMKASEAWVRLVRLGFTYLEILEEQALEKKVKTTKRTKKKRVKSKDPK